MDEPHEMELKDAAQMVIGAGAIALPVAMSQDTWEIAETLQVLVALPASFAATVVDHMS